MHQRMPARARSLHGIPSSSSRSGRYRPRARSAAACSRLPAIWFSRGRPMAISLPIPRPMAVARGRFIPPRRRSARPSVSRSASASTSRYSTDPRRERLGASVRCLPDSVGIRVRIRGACSRSCSMARAHCRRHRVRPPRRRWTAAISSSMKTLAKEGAQLFTKCQWCHGAGAIAGGGGPDLRASLSPLVAASFASVVRGGIEARGMPKFEELSDRELDALRHYIRARARRVTRPDGVAPPAPEAPAPTTEAQPEQESAPKPPPGSLESTGAPPPPQ